MNDAVPSFAKPPRKRRGFALVVTLAMLAAAMVAVLGMIVLARTDSSTVHLSMEHTRARYLAESTVAVAVAQLQEATTQTFNGGRPKPWASQPGAIRTHGMDGELDTLYKLYSASSLKANSVAELAADAPPATWQSQPEHFVDLNAPETGVDGLVFPIIDPRLSRSGSGGEAVEGFSIDAKTAPVGTTAANTAEDAMRLPMPVRWIYQLRNGEMGTLGPNNEWIGARKASQPTLRNPIVARMAFWVDDESCKINVNTAAEGSFWDTPRADSLQERALAAMQPTRLEYHRHPGHPAGVSLSSVFLPGERSHPAAFRSNLKSMSFEDARDLWKVGRLVVAEKENGTSRAGTQTPDQLTSKDFQPQPRARQMRYGDVGEVLFDTANLEGEGKLTEAAAKKDRKKQAFFERHPEALIKLKRGRGFLTATSSAPESTLWGTPRIALWPVHANTPAPGERRSGEEAVMRFSRYDQFAVLVSTLANRRYLIQRSEPGNGGMDLEVHGEGQNLRLLNYMKDLTNLPVPGFAKSQLATFANKYGVDAVTGDRDAILLSMLDYVRASNFADGQLSADTQFSVLCPGEPYYGFGQIAPLQPRVTGRASVEMDYAKGLGRMMTVSEVALVIICRAEKNASNAIVGQVTSTNRAKLISPGDREIEVGILVEGFLPQLGWPDYRPYASIALSGGPPGTLSSASNAWPAMKLNGMALVPTNTTTSLEALPSPPVGWRGWGGTTGVRGLGKGVIMFRSIAVPGVGGKPAALRLEGGSASEMQFKLAVYDTPSGAASGVSSASDLMQVIPLRFPDIVPDPAIPGSEMLLPVVPVGGGVSFALSARLADAAQGKKLLIADDIVQSLIPPHGDYRLIAAQKWAESRGSAGNLPLFGAHPNYGKMRHAHALRDPTCVLTEVGMLSSSGTGNEVAGEGYSFLPGVTIPDQWAPDFPQALTSQMQIWRDGNWQQAQPRSASDMLRLDGMQRGAAWPDVTGDFDNGTGNSPDGSYTNRTDDGNWAANKKGALPYFTVETSTQVDHGVPPVTSAAFAPLRMLPSAVVFGSLPTGTRAKVPWQTLLFRPQADHYGATDPADHLLLDLFWSPVIEPEPLSVPFETLGKINLNHAMVPFGYIHRATALHAAMKAETVMAIPDSAARTYKSGGDPDALFRRFIDAEGTISLWKQKIFDQGKLFVSASQICEHPLVPEGVTAEESELNTFWSTHRLTGDNSREMPYAHLYPRFTTRSNTYRVHFVVEPMIKARGTKPNIVNRLKDRATARMQGSCVVTRQIDFKRTDLPDYLTDNEARPLDHFYEWQIVSTSYR